MIVGSGRTIAGSTPTAMFMAAPRPRTPFRTKAGPGPMFVERHREPPSVLRFSDVEIDGSDQ